MVSTLRHHNCSLPSSFISVPTSRLFWTTEVRIFCIAYLLDPITYGTTLRRADFARYVELPQPPCVGILDTVVLSSHLSHNT